VWYCVVTPVLISGSVVFSVLCHQKLVKVVAVDGSGFNSDEWRLYVLAEQSLQKWILVLGEAERLVYECDVNRMVREAFQETVWVSCFK
jgi:hypothetical protein